MKFIAYYAANQFSVVLITFPQLISDHVDIVVERLLKTVTPDPTSFDPFTDNQIPLIYDQCVGFAACTAH